MSHTQSRVIALIVSVVFAGMASAQDLAGVAKKEQQRRKAAPAPVKTYTETDLAEVHVDAPAPPASSSTRGSAVPSSGAAASGAVASSESGAVGDEAYWRRRFKVARDAIVFAQGELARLEEVGTRLRATSGNVGMRDCSKQIAQAKPGERIRVRTCEATGVTLQESMDEARNAVTLAQRALVDLESAARQAGALPAWTR